MEGESYTVLSLRLMHKLAMSRMHKQVVLQVYANLEHDIF